MEKQRVFLQIASDLHLECLPRDALQEEEEIEEIIHPHANAEGIRILALLGDIGWPGTPVYERLVRHCSARWDHVLLVAGNHEYYNAFKRIAPFLRSASRVLALKKAAGQRPDTMQEREGVIRALCEQLDNVHFLHHDRAFDLVTADGSLYRFLGTILWSDIPERAGFKVRDGINDYRLCVIEDEKMELGVRLLSVDDTRRVHREAVQWLEAQLEDEETRSAARVVVLTHHAPSMRGTSKPKHDKDVTRHAFASNLEHLLGQMHVWAFGHTHFNSWREEDGTLLVCNQRGMGKKVLSGYRPDLTLELTADPHPVKVMEEDGQ